MFRKISQILMAPLLYLFVSPSLALADTPVVITPSGQFSRLFDLSGLSFGQVVGKVVTIAFVLAIIIALVFLIYGGIKWIVSGGDKAAVESARNTIVAAVVGLVIVFLAYFILNIILGAFGLSLTNLSIPSLTQ